MFVSLELLSISQQLNFALAYSVAAQNEIDQVLETKPVGAERGAKAAKDTHRSNIVPTIRLAGIKIADDLDLLRCEPFDHTRPRHLASGTGAGNRRLERAGKKVCARILRRGTARTFDTRAGREHGGRLYATRPGTWTQGHNDASVCRPYRRENTLLVGCASVRGRQVGMPRETRQLPPFYQHVSLRT